MNKTSQLVARVEIVGSTSAVSPENVYHSSRQKVNSSSYVGRNKSRQETKALATLEKMTGGPRHSYAPKLGGDKLNYAARTKAPSSAILVRPGEHVPLDFYAPEWLEFSKDLFAWNQVRESKSALLLWFEMTAEGKASKAIVNRLAEQLQASRENMTEQSIHGDDKAYNAAREAVEKNLSALKAAEEAHFEKGSAKHLLAKPKDPDNTKKVVTSILEAMTKPGEHLKARQTPEALRKISVDKNGQVTGKPSADRVRTSDGNVSLVEPLEDTAEDIEADKKESAQHRIQKTSDGLSPQVRATESKIEFLRAEVARLEKEKAAHGLGKSRAADLARLTVELKSAQTRLGTKLEPVIAAVRGRGVKVITDKPESKKAGTQVCAKHSGTLSCACHAENFKVEESNGKRTLVRVDPSRGVVKRGHA